MPFLRRRGDLASESDMRRRTQVDPDSILSQVASPSPPSNPAQPRQPSATSTVASDASEARDSHSVHEEAEDHPSLHQSLTSIVDRPQTPPANDDAGKQRRFSLLRFRNASDSQLSVRARQQAEKPPPVPIRREHSSLPLLPFNSFS